MNTFDTTPDFGFDAFVRNRILTSYTKLAVLCLCCSIAGTSLNAQTSTLKAKESTTSLTVAFPQVPVTGGQFEVGTVTASGFDTSSSLTVALTTSDPNVKVLPTVTIPPGQNSVTFPVLTVPVFQPSTKTIQATVGNTAGKGSFMVVGGNGNQPTVTGFTVTPQSISGLSTAIGLVTISDKATGPGANILIYSDDPSVIVPPVVVVPSGQVSTTFIISTSSANIPVNATLTAYSPTNLLHASLVVTGRGAGPATGIITGITFNPDPVIGGATTTGTLTIGNPAGDGGSAVTLTSDNGSAMVPTTILIPPGQTSATFTVNTGTVSADSTAHIIATSGNSFTAALSITQVSGTPAQAAVLGVLLWPNPVTGGSPSNGIVSLAAPAGPGGVSLTLTVDTEKAIVPATIIIPAGQGSGVFNINTLTVNATTVAKIVVTSLNSVNASLTINPVMGRLGTVSGVNINPNPVTGGSNATGTVTLATPAGPGGVTVTLTSSSGSATVPVMITIPEGQTAGTFTVTTTPVTSPTTVVITAVSANTTTATLDIEPNTPGQGTIASLTVAPNPVTGGNQATGTVTLASAAGSSGVLVTFSSDNANATVPASITIPAGQTTGTITVNTSFVNSPTTANLTAASGNTTTAALNINPAGPSQGTISGVTFSPNPVTGGSPATGTVTLAAPAGPGGVAVTLASGSGSATVPVSITIPAGQTAGTFTVATSPVGSTTTASITATSANTITGTLTINPASAGQGTISGFTVAPNPVVGGNLATGTITLASAAGAGGVLVTLSSNSGNASVPASITIPAGQSMGTFPVNTTTVNSSVTAQLTATSANTSTASLTINPATAGQGTISGFSVAPNPVVGGNLATGTVTLGSPAGAGGVLVTLASNNANATVPASITIPSGQTSGTFPVTTTAVNNPVTATLTATSANTANAALTVNPPAAGQGTITGFSVAPNPVVGGNSATGTVTLGGPAGAGGVLVTLGSNNANATVPASITIPAGQTSGTFPVTTTAVNNPVTATLTATSANTANAALTINPPAAGQGTITGFSVAPNPVVGGNSATGTVTLSGPAGAGGVLVTLGSNNANATVPASITIPAGQTSGTFPVTTSMVNSQVTAQITATSANTANTNLTINPPAPGQGTITGLSVAPNPVTGGNSATGTVTLGSPAGAGGVLVTLASNNANATVPASITIQSGQTSGTFPVTTTAVNSPVTATLTATSANTANAPLTINPPAAGQGTITGFSVAPNPVVGGNSATGTVTLGSPAGAGGVLVTLASNNANATVPASITIPSGQTSGTFPVTTTAVSSAVTATLTATSANTTTTPLTINPPAAGQGTITGFSVAPNPVVGGNSAMGTVTLGSPAGAGGVLVTLGSNNANATVPASITIPAGQTSGTFPVTTTAVSSPVTATLTATSANTANAALTINPPAAGQGTITGFSVAPNPVVGGNSATGSVTLGSPAGAGGVLVTLGSNNANATVPASITIPAGQTIGTFPVTTSVVNSQVTAQLTATSANTANTNVTINPPSPGQGTITGLSVSPNPVTGGNSATGTVTLGSAAGAGGVLVTLGSNNSNATVPASITIPSGQSSGTFPVTTSVVNSQVTAQLTATSANTANTNLTINPPSPGQGTITGLSVSPNPVTGGNSATGTVTLGSPAGAGGVQVNLASNNANATVPASITIPSGQSSGTFPVTTNVVNSQVMAQLTATSANTANTNLTINPAGPGQGTITSLTLSPNPVTGGDQSTGTVTIASPAGANGVLVNLGSDNANATVPANIVIPSGQTSGSFTINTSVVNSKVLAHITATSGNSALTTLIINPQPCVQNLTLNLNLVTGGNPLTGTVTLTSPAPSGGQTVQLLYTGLGVSGPASIIVQPGQTTATFNVTTNTVAAIVQGAVQAITGPCPGVTANVQVVPLPVLTGVTISPSGISLGGQALGTVTLSGVSSTDTVVNLKSSLPLTQLGIPATVTVPAGAKTATFPVFSITSGLLGILQPLLGTVTATLGNVSVSTGLSLLPI